ncbi:MAG: glycosyltransferase [Verrucomicrobia bacterium]|nr:glycosyltransferase [Verrucomicrobiota bacterium]
MGLIDRTRFAPESIHGLPGKPLPDLGFGTPRVEGKLYQSIAVVIPTYNRWDCLSATLDALLAQDRSPDEVIVVDDGSTDDTGSSLQAWGREHACPFRFATLRQENAGPARARNVGVEHARSDLIAFLGDDTIPEPDWVGLHLKMQNDLGEGCAVVGYTGWDTTTVHVTPFLRYINGRGAQFKYDLMEDGQDVPFDCFYTSNLSLPRNYLLAEPFNPVFRQAGWEDVDVGYRLVRRGMRIVYNASARTRHRHATTMESFMQRQFNVGRMCPQILELHPEMGAKRDFEDTPALRCFIGFGYFARLFLPVVRSLDYQRVPLPRMVYLFYLGWYYVRGLMSARRDISANQA